jgi:hypothetical protein
VAASAQSLLATASYGVGALIGALGAGELARTMGSGAIFEGLAVAAALASLSAWAVLRAGASRSAPTEPAPA